MFPGRGGRLPLIGHAFAELGWKPEPGDTVEFRRFTDSIGIVEQYRHVTRNLLRDLEKHGG
jgi:hypothetical protein